MTKILYCNNYAANGQALENVRNGLYPRHHLWGIFEFCGNKNFIVEFSESPDMNLHKSKILRLIIILFYQIKTYLKYKNFDVVYSACSHQIDFFAFMKRIGVFKGNLFAVVHHPQKIPFYSSYKKIVCISKYTQKILRDKYCIENTQYIFWGPDLSFYHRYERPQEKKYDFYSNGKTLRDFTLLEDVFQHCDYKLLILQNSVNGKNIHCISRVSDVENVKFCCLSKVMLIPLKKGITQICGLTSLIDALALKLPFVISDSANLGFSNAGIESLLGGIVYKSSDKEDFLEKLKKSIENYGQNLAGYAFALENDYEQFRNKISALLLTK